MDTRRPKNPSSGSPRHEDSGGRPRKVSKVGTSGRGNNKPEPPQLPPTQDEGVFSRMSETALLGLVLVVWAIIGTACKVDSVNIALILVLLTLFYTRSLPRDGKVLEALLSRLPKARR